MLEIYYITYTVILNEMSASCCSKCWCTDKWPFTRLYICIYHAWI